MSVTSSTKSRFHVGALIVGLGPSDGGPNPNSGLNITATSAGGAVTNISAAASAVVTFTNAHGLNVGQLVNVTSPSTFTGATNPFPGTYVITAINIASKTITLGGCVTTGATISGYTGVVVNLVDPPRGNGIAPSAMTGTSTVTVTAPGEWSPGQQVFIAGVTTMTNVNGLQTVATGGNGTFTFAPATAASGTAGLTNAQIYDYPLTNNVVPNGPSPRTLKGMYLFENITLTPGALTTNTSVTLTVTLPGVNIGDVVLTQPVGSADAVGGAAAGITIDSSVTGPNTVTVVVQNVTAGSITATPQVNFLWLRFV